MQLHQLKSKTKKKTKKRIGRGGKRGTFSGRGTKGQRARAGRKIRPELRDVIKKLPKKRGYRFASFKKKSAEININVLEKNFNGNDKINPLILLKKGIIKKRKGFLPIVKLLGSGNLTKKLFVSKCQISKSAKEKIEAAGGQVI